MLSEKLHQVYEEIMHALILIFSTFFLQNQPEWSVESLRLVQEQSDWFIDYRFKNQTTHDIEIKPDNTELWINSWVSNSHVKQHAVPKKSEIHIETLHNQGSCYIFNFGEEPNKCKEEAYIFYWNNQSSDSFLENNKQSKSCVVQPQDLLCFRIQLKHVHLIYGTYDTLLGSRNIKLKMGNFVFEDQVELLKEQYTAFPKPSLAVAEEKFYDKVVFRSKPDSILLEANDNSYMFNYCRFNDFPVRHGSKMKLTLWYMVAKGSKGTLNVVVPQTVACNTFWRSIEKATMTEELSTKTQGLWIKYEKIIKIDDLANSSCVSFRIKTNDSSMIWIDDVQIEFIGDKPVNP